MVTVTDPLIVDPTRDYRAQIPATRHWMES
jgi:hypothetical protein